MKKPATIFQRALVRSIMHFFSWLFSWLPTLLVWTVANAIFKIAYVFMGRQRRIAEESVDLALKGEKSLAERERIIRECMEGLGRGGVEMMLAISRPGYAQRIVTIEGEERLEKALSLGRGVIAVTAHFGNFPLMMLYISRKGYKSSCIIRPARDEKMEEFLTKKRIEQGLKTIYAIPRQQCVTESLKVLRNNEILFIPVDQNFGAKGGVFVNFFGQQASTPTGPIVFARRSGAVILPVFIIRQGDNTHKIIIEEPLNLVDAETEEEALKINMQNMTNIIEHYIRLHPTQWAWMHRRWKTQPSLNDQ